MCITCNLAIGARNRGPLIRQRLRWRIVLSLMAFLVAFGCSFPCAQAQRARFDDAFQVFPQGQSAPIVKAPVIQQPFGQGPAIITQPNIITGPNVLNSPAPAFDPFRTRSNPFPVFPQQQPVFGGVQAPSSQIQILPPTVNQPQQFQFQPPQPGYPQGVAPYNQSPYGPQGTGWPSMNWAWPSQVWTRLRSQVFPRLLERPRFRHTWLEGGDDNELDINDIELATTMTFANWLGTSQPIRVSPGFTFHFWDGPNTLTTGFDLPSKAYSIYLATDYTTDPRRQSGVETAASVGFYSDFTNTSSDGIRLTGSLLGWSRMNSYTTFKFGVEYLDRVDIKLLPAIGVFLTPNPDLMFNVYFPRPKLAQRLPRVGPFEVWGYIGAEYGGGSWAIEREPMMGPKFNDQVDINDVRAFVGLEWMGERRVTGFLEFGYAFEREILYASDPGTRLDLKDTIMIRSGLAF